MVFRVGKTQPLQDCTTTAADTPAPTDDSIYEEGDVCNFSEREEINKDEKLPHDEMLSFGLRCVGFDESR